jgi:hypothetical protein
MNISLAFKQSIKGTVPQETRSSLTYRYVKQAWTSGRHFFRASLAAVKNFDFFSQKQKNNFFKNMYSVLHSCTRATSRNSNQTMTPAENLPRTSLFVIKIILWLKMPSQVHADVLYGRGENSELPENRKAPRKCRCACYRCNVLSQFKLAFLERALSKITRSSRRLCKIQEYLLPLASIRGLISHKI